MVTKTMTEQWNERAQENAYYWVNTEKTDWKKEEYYKSGDKDITQYVLPFFKKKNIPKEEYSQFSTLDIGCGTGRLTRSLGKICKHVTGIDVSTEMVAKAKEDNIDMPNLEFIAGKGTDLSAIRNESIDFCFSFIVFQHIPSKKIIRSYIKDLYRTLKPGSWIKIQVRGKPGNPPGKVIWFHGFQNFYVALVLWRNILPIPWYKPYNMLYGACYNKHQLFALLHKLGFTDIHTYRETERHLWVEARKPA